MMSLSLSLCWQMLNMAVMVAVSIIWAPSERAKEIAFSQQLRLDDLDAFDNADDDASESWAGRGEGKGQFSILDEDGLEMTEAGASSAGGLQEEEEDGYSALPAITR